MKKKQYIIPEVKEVEIECVRLMSSSGVSSEDIGWGGTDDNGTIIPSTRGNDNPFDTGTEGVFGLPF